MPRAKSSAVAGGGDTTPGYQITTDETLATEAKNTELLECLVDVITACTCVHTDVSIKRAWKIVELCSGDNKVETVAARGHCENSVGWSSCVRLKGHQGVCVSSSASQSSIDRAFATDNRILNDAYAAAVEEIKRLGGKIPTCVSESPKV